MFGRLGKIDRIALIYLYLYSTLVHVYLSTTYGFSPGPFGC